MFSPALQTTNNFSWSSLSLTISILVVSLLLSAFILWRRYRSRRLLLRRVAELETLSAAGRAIVTAELDVAALSQLIAREAGQVIDNSTFQVGLFEEELYHILYWTIDGQEQEMPRTFDLRKNSGMVGWIRDSKQPLLVRDFHKEMDALPARPRYVSSAPPRSAVFIPLISGEEVIGVIAAQSPLPNRFNEEDLRRLMILANQAAAAIAHARLYAQARRRAAHLELVGQIARQINTSQDQAEIFDQVVRLTRQTFGFHPVSIFVVDPQTGEAVLEATTATELLDHHVRLAAAEGPVGMAIATRETVLSNVTGEDEHFLAHTGPTLAAMATTTRSEMVIPLFVDGEVLGVLDLQSSRTGGFTVAEKGTLAALAAEVAIALDKVRQLVRQQEQAWITTAQLQVAEAISRSADLDELVIAVTRLTPMLVGVSFCSILLWDEDTAVYRVSSRYCCTVDTTAADFENLEVAIGDWPALDAVHVGQQALTTHKIPAWFKRAVGAPSLAAATLFPISVTSRVLGIMIVGPLTATGDDGGREGHRRRQELLDDIAAQTAQAIESAYLRNAQQEEAWVNTALLQVAEAVNRLIDLNEILDTIIRLIPMLVGVESAIILVWDEEEQIFRIGPSHGIAAMGRGLLQTLELDRDEFAAITAQPADFLSPTATYYTVQLPPWLAKVLGTSKAYAFPLHARGQLVGALVVGTSAQNGGALSTRRLNILNGIAHQAATAVVNHQLYNEAAERSRLEQELSVAHEIQASLIPPGNPAIPGCSVASCWLAARQVSGDFYDFLPLANGNWGIVVADVADKGVPAALFMALSRTILRTVAFSIAFSRANPADVLMRVNEIIINDAQSDLFVTLFYAVWQPQTRSLAYANAGHNPPLLLRQSGKTHLLNGDGMALGVLPNAKIEGRTIPIHPGDTLLIYTDGVTEATNEDFDEFGMSRLHLTAETHKRRGAHEIMEAVVRAVKDHAGDTPQFDDLTLVVMKHENS